MDESSFSINTILNKGFAITGKYCYHPESKQRPEVINLIAGISFEFGMEGFILTKQNVNTTLFLQILNVFDRNGSEYVLFGDNASWHVSHECFREL